MTIKITHFAKAGLSDTFGQPKEEQGATANVHVLEEQSNQDLLIAAEMPDGNVVQIFGFAKEYGLTGATMVRKNGVALSDVVERYSQSLDLEDPGSIGDSEIQLAKTVVHEGLLAPAISKDGITENDADKAIVSALKGFLPKIMSQKAFDLLSVLPPAVVVVNGQPQGEAFAPNIAYLTGGNPTARLQALSSNLGLRDLLLSNAHIREGIDNRAQLNEMVTEHYGFTKTQFNAFRKICKSVSTYLKDYDAHDSQYTTTWMADTDTLAQTARLVRPDQVPSDWRSTNDMIFKVKGLKAFVGSLNLGQSFLKRTIRPIKPDEWTEALPGVEQGRYSFDKGLSDYIGATANLMSSAIILDELLRQSPDLLAGAASSASRLISGEDLSEDETATLSEPTSFFNRKEIKQLHRILGEQLSEVFASHANMKELRERATRWHHINQLLDSQVVSEGMDIYWSPLAGEIDLDDVLAVEKTSSKSLAEQGKAENHCVGSYVNVVLSPPYGAVKSIFSLEDKAGILSTIEVQISKSYDDKGKSRLVVQNIQHQAHSNTPPSAKAERAAIGLIEAINKMPQEHLKTYFESIQNNSHNLRQKVSQTIGAWKGNVYDEGFTQTALEVFDEVLPRKLRGQSIQSLRDKIDAQIDSKGGGAITEIIEQALSSKQEFSIKAPGKNLVNECANIITNRREKLKQNQPLWLGVILSELDVSGFEVNLSGYGDSGAIDDYCFKSSTHKGRDLQSADIQAKLAELRLPGERNSFSDVLDLFVENDATAEGNWYDNDGGSVWSEYSIQSGALEQENICLTYNEPEYDDDFDEDDDEEIENLAT